MHYNEPGKLKELLRDGANVNTTDRVIMSLCHHSNIRAVVSCALQWARKAEGTSERLGQCQHNRQGNHYVAIVTLELWSAVHYNEPGKAEGTSEGWGQCQHNRQGNHYVAIVTLELWSAVHYNEPGKLKELLRDGANVSTTDRVIMPLCRHSNIRAVVSRALQWARKAEGTSEGWGQCQHNRQGNHVNMSP